MKTIHINSVREFVVLASTEGGHPILVTLKEILESHNTEASSEMMYCLWEQTDKILDLKPYESMSFQPNRDDKESRGVIARRV